ncbi:tumor necrosis factor alpha-induced protein 2-like isoform X2 [Parambassis ranga]|nr:tumor necrosis factor alpha-induced protein 2-like isoform X2 [Parambassis ranga]
MRIRSGSSETDSGGGGWIPERLQRLWRNPAGQVAVSSTTDERRPSGKEEVPVLIPTFEENLEEQHLCEASQLLIDREKQLFGEMTETADLQHHQAEVEKLSADREALEKLILQTVLQSLSLCVGQVDNEHLVSAQASALTSAVRAVMQEEEQDQLWKHRCRIQPDWRPSNWKKLHDSTIRVLVESRMDNPTFPSAASHTEQSSVQADVYSMGRQLKEDLLWVVTVVKDCYPPEMDICNFYAELYHKTFRARIKKLADFCLDDKDSEFLLRWVNHSYPGILQKPELAGEIDVEALGKLLPNDILDPMEEQYLNKQQADLMRYIRQVLTEAKERWNKGEEPPTEDGCYASHVAYDIIQFINGMVTSAAVALGDPDKAKSLTSKLTDLMQSFKAFQEEVVKHNRSNSITLVKANLGCIEQFRDVLSRMTHLFPDGVRLECLSLLTDMTQSAHAYLLSPVHKVLKPQYQKLGTDDWLNKNQFENLLKGIESQLHELKGSTPACYQKLLGQLYQEVAVEYVKRLLKGKVKLKDRQRQEKAYVTVKENAESLHKLFNRMGSNEEWLKEILTKIAEVLKLQDIPAIQMQIVLLGSAHRDLSEKHVSALLKLKKNISKSDRKTVKETLTDTRKENNDVDGNTQPFFCKVVVS